MKKFVIWPNEIDARLSKKYGRQVSKTSAVSTPKLKEIVDAIRYIDAKIIEIDENKLNPRLSGLDEEFKIRGMIKVESRYGKSETLRLIAEKIKEFRKPKKRR
ncbi:hypothetical protein PAP_00180 [Palaeococcus pacificus DY20341]|uniref:SRP19 n=1 Tax=Palaeococcus pacificus DY20341 TaxID=1343739 RepID=A0A075LVI4_9EURY|nr:signal recognition particle protein Srp19 [Palaeococcus pacificus]AIF68483.1 hypothetical protein PAP_00180 [Palaeococcus pacificus DY20341]